MWLVGVLLQHLTHLTIEPHILLASFLFRQRWCVNALSSDTVMFETERQANEPEVE
jgi:hypothetical protein